MKKVDKLHRGLLVTNINAKGIAKQPTEHDKMTADIASIPSGIQTQTRITNTLAMMARLEKAEDIVIKRPELEFCQWLAAARSLAELSLHQLSRLTEIDDANLSKYENYFRSPTLKTVCRIADKLGYEVVLRRKEQ